MSIGATVISPCLHSARHTQFDAPARSVNLSWHDQRVAVMVVS